MPRSRSGALSVALVWGALGVAACGRPAPSVGGLPVPPVPTADASVAAPLGSGEILWDTYGVPHIFAEREAGLFHAFALAQMQNHGDLLLREYGAARGRAAEYWGDAFLDSDRWVRTMGTDKRAHVWYAAQRPDFRRDLDAFAGGINAFAKAHPDRLAADVKVVLPVTGEDVLAHVERVLLLNLVSQKPAAQRGSNAWAIAPARTTDGHAILLANPHLPWGGVYTFFEAQLSAPGVDVYGAALVGFPVLAIAFNEDLAWTHTISAQDVEDLYELTLAPGGYRFDDAVRPFEIEQQVLKVRRPDGTLASEPLTIRRSIHGPVISEDAGKAVAIRIVGLDMAQVLDVWWRLGQAHSLAAFETELQRNQLPRLTVTYADRAGHILHFGGSSPDRPPGGTASDWAGYIPGETSATLWTALRPYTALPRIVDPPGGWVQNTNEPSWFATVPPTLDPSRFPPDLAASELTFPGNFRTQRSIRLLGEHPKVTLDQVVALKHSTRLESADRLLPDLLAAVKKRGTPGARSAAKVLGAWDRSTDAGSRGALLYSRWVWTLISSAQGEILRVPWSPSSPLDTPTGLADAAAGVRALEATVAELTKERRKLDEPWGDSHRLQRDGLDLPASGTGGDFGSFRVLEYERLPDGRESVVGGDSYVAAIEFSTPLRARALIGYGNASQAGSPHRTDQLDLASRKELRAVWRTRDEILGHLRERQAF